MASQLRGMEPLLMDLIDAPDFVVDLLAFCAEVGAVFGAALSRAGGHAIMLGDALCSPATISPTTYRRVAQPVHTEMIRRLHEAGAETVIMHVCGDIRPIIPDLVATGADVLDLDTAVPLDEARALAGPVVGFRGNVSPSFLYRAAPAAVLEVARQTIDAGGSTSFVLGTGCEVPIGTAIENVIAMVDASRQASARDGARGST